MIKKTIEIKNPTGLHTRPGTKFVRLAKTFPCDITVVKEGKEANAKSLVKLLKIGISQGDVIELTADGEDEERAAEELESFIKNLDE